MLLTLQDLVLSRSSVQPALIHSHQGNPFSSRAWALLSRVNADGRALSLSVPYSTLIWTELMQLNPGQDVCCLEAKARCLSSRFSQGTWPKAGALQQPIDSRGSIWLHRERAWSKITISKSVKSPSRKHSFRELCWAELVSTPTLKTQESAQKSFSVFCVLCVFPALCIPTPGPCFHVCS